MRSKRLRMILAGGVFLFTLAAFRAGAIGEIKGMVFEAEQKEETPKPGTTNILFTFGFTNTSAADITITTVRASCGCTTLDIPQLPWTVGAGKSGKISANVDVRGKFGVLMKSLSVESSAGVKHLILKINLPGQDPVLAEMNDRIRNQQLSLVDRQIVFRGDCARCHAEPAKGKTGQELFAGVCAVCHDTPHRATMVPDLYALNKPTDANYWRTWIMFGREGSLMPAFRQDRGGPLTPEQIESLVQYLTTRPPKGPVTGAAPAPTQASIPPLPVGAPRVPQGKRLPTE